MTNEKAVVQEALLRTALENSFGTEASGGFTLTGDSTNGWTIVAKGVTYSVDLHGNKIEQNPNSGPIAIAKLTTDKDSTIVDTNGYALNNTEVTDTTTAKTFWVPKDFKILTGTDSITGQAYPTEVDKGIVVEDRSGNQFVWVPVPDVIWDGSTTITSGTYTPMAATYTYTNSSVSGTLYKGLLYDTIWGDTDPIGYGYKSDYDVGTILYREPSLITEDSSVMWAPMPIEEGQTDVAGSYYDVGRFETGIESNTDDTTYKKTVSKKATTSGTYPVTTADATAEKGNTWYGLYKMQKEFATTSGKVRSSMIWGSQYDAMMNWMAKTGKDVITADSNKYNTAQTTGSKVEDIINNVFDLYGCHYEWTLEASYTGDRAYRGGPYYQSRVPVVRDYSGPPGYAGDAQLGSRLTLYIVD